MGIGTGGQDRTECLFWDRSYVLFEYVYLPNQGTVDLSRHILMICLVSLSLSPSLIAGCQWRFESNDVKLCTSDSRRAKMFKRVQPLAAIGQNSEIQPISSTFYAWMRPWKRLKRLSQPPWWPGWDRLLWWNMPILASRILKASSRHAHHICANIN